MLDAQDSWSSVHNSYAELIKFKCLHLMGCVDMAHPDFKHTSLNVVIKSVDSTRILCVEVDYQLCWR